MTDQDRKFESGATRSSITDRYDPEAALSPLVVERYAAYIHGCNRLKDGTVRSDDNWQKGIPLAVYMKGAWRHFLHAWQRHRGWPVEDPKAAQTLEDDLCAVLFNVQGYLHELLVAKAKTEAERKAATPVPSPLEGQGEFVKCKCGWWMFHGVRPGDLPPSVVDKGKTHTPEKCT